MTFPSDGYRVTEFFPQCCEASQPQGYRVTDFFPQCCRQHQPQGYRVTDFFQYSEMSDSLPGYRVTDFFPKVKVSHALFSAQGYRIQPSGLPLSKGLNRSILFRKSHEVTGLPLFYTSLLYRTRKKALGIFFSPFKRLYFSKFGNSVTLACKPASALGNSGYRVVVTRGNLGNLGKSPRKHVADGRSLS